MVFCVGAIVVLLPMLPGLALRFAGFSPAGSTEQVFSGVVAAPTVQLENAVGIPDASVNLGEYGTVDLPATVAVGNTSGGEAAVVEFSESQLMNLCYERSTVCAGGNGQVRNAQVDLRPGGGVVYADVYLRDVGIWQNVGAVFRLDSSGRQLEVVGVDVGGTLYSLPASVLGEQVQQALDEGNALLNQAVLEAGGGQYRLADVQINDQSITLVMR
jgi:hypothetical protein